MLVAFATYAPSLNGELVWDDHYLVGENPFFRSPVFAAEVFRRHLFTESFSTYYRPVQNLSYMLDYWAWGDSTTGYHCTNVLLHALAAWLLFLLLLRLLPALWKGGAAASVAVLLVAFIWLVHPVHNAAIAYISGRADSLAALFALGAWLMWSASRDCSRSAGRALGGLAAALLFLIALCSKEIALVWALLFVLHAIFFERTLNGRARILGIAGLVAVVAVYAVLHSLPEHRAGVPGAVPEPLGSRAVLALRALGDYSRLMFAPARLMMERSLGPSEMYASRSGWWHGIASEYLSLLGAAALVAAVWLCMRRGEARSLRRFGALWFLVAFVPISNLIPLNAEVAEHWIYTASIGFLLLAVGAVALLPPRAMRWSAALALAAVAALAVRTSFRAADWVDGETFARRTIENGGASPRLLTFYANELGRKGRLVEQEQVYRKMLTIYPDFMTARINLGVCLQKQGRAEEAKPLLDIGSANTVVSTVPRNWNAALNAAGQLHKEGRSAEALALVREWKPSNPHTWELAGFEANVLRETQGAPAALAVVEKFALAHWWHLPSQIGMASLQREAGDPALALATARNAQRLDIRGAAAFDEAAKCEASLGKMQEALESQATAVARAPRNAAYLEFFSALLHGLGREGEAQAARRKAEALTAAARQRLP
jgi:tetratricopeptide (TPR) repeat protein